MLLVSAALKSLLMTPIVCVSEAVITSRQFIYFRLFCSYAFILRICWILVILSWLLPKRAQAIARIGNNRECAEGKTSISVTFFIYNLWKPFIILQTFFGVLAIIRTLAKSALFLKIFKKETRLHFLCFAFF